MQRIAIIGPGGSGKSRLATELGRRLDLPVIHLDDLFWQPGWVEPDRDEWEALNRPLVEGERWILDGNYGGTMEIRLAAADTIVFLDLPPLLCIWRVLRRRRRVEPASARRFLEFVTYIWRYRRTRRPAVEERIARHGAGKQVHVLHSRRDVRLFLALVSPTMKVGIVVPYSWSFWGAVVEHAELQAEALRKLGIETRTIMGNDPPGQFTRVLHPRVGRHGNPPDDVIPIGRSVIVPANGTLPNIILSPRSLLRIKRVLERERFDVLHLHEPMTPIPCIATLALAKSPMVATHHASGDLSWMKLAKPVWGFLGERIDHRIAVSEQARETAERWVPGEYEVIPNGVLIPPEADPGGREHRILFAGRQEQRKGLHVLLRAWPEIRRRSGATLRIAGADPLAVRLLLSRLRVPEDGIDVLGFLSQDELTAELLAAKALVAPSLGGESFGMVLTRAFACATPAAASDIPGYRAVATPETAVLFPPGDGERLTEAVVGLLDDEERRVALGAAARELAVDRYSWDDIGRRLAGIYERLTA